MCIEIVSLLEEKEMDKSSSAVRKRFNKISDPDKRKKIKQMLNKEYNQSKCRDKRTLEEIEYEMNQF